MYKYQKQTQQQDIGFFLMSLFFVIVFWFVFSVLDTAHAEESIDGYTVNQYVEAIFLAEGGERAEYPYGIRSIKCSTKSECRRICYNTVRNNRDRFRRQKVYKDFLSFLGSRYCPTTGNALSPMESKLNKNWQKNVRYFLAKGN